ncbi:MAG: transposase [Planctomycetaceae bacterium]
MNPGFYFQRGNVPERPIGEPKNDLHMDRLSSQRFLANSHKRMTPLLAYALYVLFREANEATPKVNRMEVSTARTRLFKVGALVQATHRHLWFRVASHWPGATLLTRAVKAVNLYGTAKRLLSRENRGTCALLRLGRSLALPVFGQTPRVIPRLLRRL